MIKQDNRPQPTSSDSRFETLRNLLLDDRAEDQKETKTEEAPQNQKQEKIIFISVNGNNNIVSAEKSRCTSRVFWKKTSFTALIAGCLLFF